MTRARIKITDAMVAAAYARFLVHAACQGFDDAQLPDEEKALFREILRDVLSAAARAASRGEGGA